MECIRCGGNNIGRAKTSGTIACFDCGFESDKPSQDIRSKANLFDRLNKYLERGLSYMVWDGKSVIDDCGDVLFKGNKQELEQFLNKELNLEPIVDPSEGC